MNYIRKNIPNHETKYSYNEFAKINGEHPFKTQVPLGRIEYRVRFKKGGKVSFFNFELAKEMGLISKSHPNKLNDELEHHILRTFSLVIINEFDQLNGVKIPKEDIYPNTYMATRYLQLQHPDKTGRTSGDGRSIWNGTLKHDGVTWDISSCGTGATKLSPACNLNKKFYQTGDPSISYGCGLSEVGEGLETLFFSEVLEKNGLNTERVLAIIEYGKGIAINVRAYPNLIRPSHFFSHLKQGNFTTLKQVADYYCSRQIENKIWAKTKFKNDIEKYYYLASQVAKSFAETAAKFEDEYIFCWLDWDGDNILMDGGIIDYGSIRQFGLFHSEYRFDDVQRFSTTILEQKHKAKYIVQCFVQIADFLSTGSKSPLSKFKNHELMKYFDDHFSLMKDRNILAKIGLNNNHQDILLNKHRNIVKKFRKAFTYFERSKSKRGLYKVADGITRDAIFCMRDILREYPQLYLIRKTTLRPEEFIEILKSSYAKKSDLELSDLRIKQIHEFQRHYLFLIAALEKETKLSKAQILLELTMRSSIINKYDRVTGNSITYIVDKVQKLRPKLSTDELFQLATEFSTYQNLNPDNSGKRINTSSRQKNILRNIQLIVRDCREGL